jgi:caffeoyl-CoA O-methyltransferase
MQAKSPFLWTRVARYAREHSSAPDPVLTRLAAETRAKNSSSMPAVMQISSDEGKLLTILAASVGPRRAIEIGTFTGYSALCIARGLPPGGHLLTLDVSAEYTAVAREFWHEGGVGDRIELRLGPAAASLDELPAEPTFGFAFIDADKESYVTYWELLLPRMLPGGLVLVDNVLHDGEVAYPFARSGRVDAIRRFNEHVRADPRVEQVLLTVADGVTLARVLP